MKTVRVAITGLLDVDKVIAPLRLSISKSVLVRIDNCSVAKLLIFRHRTVAMMICNMLCFVESI